MSESCYLCLHVPEFPAQARLRHRHEMRSKAVVVLDGTPPLEMVCSSTQAARKIGIERGTTRAELDSFPGVEILKRSVQEEQAAAAALLASVWRFSPRVQVLAARDAAHRLVVDVAGTERIFGRSEQIAQYVLRECRALGVSVRAAVSGNFHAAVCAAPYAGMTARVIRQGWEREALAPLPLPAVETLTEEQHETFAMWGLRTLGEIAALPEEQLIARMGQAGNRVWLMARGEHPHLMEPEQEHFTLEEQTSFDAPVEMLDSLLFVMGPMLDQLVLRASSRSYALASVTVRLELTSHAAEDTAIAQDAAIYTRTIKPALPLADSRILLKLLHLELQAHPPGAPVTSVALTAEPGARARAQLGLFSPQLPEPSRLDITLARIRAMVGEDRVGRPKLLDTHEPEGFIVEHFTAQADGKYDTPPAASQTFAGLLGLRRIRPPAVLRVSAKARSPESFWWQGERYKVAAAYGPWRQSGNWWSGAAWSQEEWDVSAAATNGNSIFCRLARDLLCPQWRLVGLYD